MEEELQRIILQNDDVDPDVALLICLHEAGRDDLALELSSAATPENLRNLASPHFQIPGISPEPISISRFTLAEKSDDISELFIWQMEQLVQQQKYDLAVGWIQYSLTGLMRSLLGKAINLNSIYNRANRLRGAVSKIAAQLGAHEYTLEFSVGLSTGVTIGFHFKVPSAKI